MTKAEAARLNGKKGGRPRKDRAAPVGFSASQTTGHQKPPNAGRGRKPGVPNKATQEIKSLCAQIVDDPRYFKKLQARALAGKLPPAVETMLWYYRLGKPRESVSLDGTIRQLTTVILRPRATETHAHR